MTAEKLSKAKLILEDGSIFIGSSFSVSKNVSGEVVFNTGMVGYTLSLTDPSYKGEILALTYPLIGNYGVRSNSSSLPIGFESNKIQAEALIISDYSFNYSHWQAKKSLQTWLKKEKIPAIFGIDVRALTKRLREKGTMLGKIEISTAKNKLPKKILDPNKRNLVDEVSTKKVIPYGNGKRKIVLVDCGVKNNIIRSLVQRKVEVIRVPWDYNFFKEIDKIDGVLFSNGPGDPMLAKKSIESMKKCFEYNVPTFGICLGSQLMGLAAGAKTFKLKYGHRSQNQPCLMNGTKKAFITSQNHGYAVTSSTIPKNWKSMFTNLNDKSNEGIIHSKKPFFSVQFHPEASPGPYETGFLFDKFLGLIK